MNRTGVLNTSPLIAFTRLGRMDLVAESFDIVLAPVEVAVEFGELPAKVEVRDLADRELYSRLRVSLGAGESAAIALAHEAGGVPLVMDERRGRRVALQLGLKVTGTLGIIAQAKRAGRVPSARSLYRDLEGVGFRFQWSIAESLCALVGE